MKRAKSTVLNSLGRLARDLAHDAGIRGLESAAFVLVGAFVEGIGLLLLIPFFALIIGTHAAPTVIERYVESAFNLVGAVTRTERLATLIAVFAALLLFRAFVIVRRDTLLAGLQQGFMQRVRSRLSRKLAASDWAVTSKLRHSTIAHVISTDVQQVSYATSVICHDSAAAVLLLTQVAIAFTLSPAMAAVAAGVVAIGAITILPMLERARKFGAYVTSTNQSLTEDTSQFLGALKLAVSQNLQDGFTQEFDASLSSLTSEQVRYTRRQSLTQQALTTATSLVGAGVVVLGIVVFHVPAPVLIALLLIFTRINSPATALYFDLQHLAQMLPAYESIAALEEELASHRPEQTIPGTQDAISLHGTIQFQKVTFLHRSAVDEVKYGGVRSLSLNLEPGSVVGISGSSGAGKTTFADLLVGLYSPQSGTIAIGGTELRGAAINSWRNKVGYVAQDPFLFHDSIRRNLLWANPKSDEDALWSALGLACAAEFVRTLPSGLDTIVGERGSLISGGERQRISLARAILRKPDLLILDEATNAIDIGTEQRVIEGLIGLVPRPTLVIIAHRPESLRHCERILAFENGALVADNPGPMAATARPA
jgi:ATP-binding cassette subfamily C protein